MESIVQLSGCTTSDTVTEVLGGVRCACFVAAGFLGRYGLEFDLLGCCGFDDAVDVDAREMNGVGVERTDWDDVLCLDKVRHISMNMCGV